MFSDEQIAMFCVDRMHSPLKPSAQAPLIMKVDKECPMLCSYNRDESAPHICGNSFIKVCTWYGKPEKYLDKGFTWNSWHI